VPTILATTILVAPQKSILRIAINFLQKNTFYCIVFATPQNISLLQTFIDVIFAECNCPKIDFLL
jgi:hypothetical protein